MFRILVVEDDIQLNKNICTYLGDCGFEAKGCLEASSAYDELCDNVYDLVISDIMMPGIDGFEFAKAVRTTDSELPLLFISARDDIAAKQRGFSAGIDDYMVKPLDLEELVLRVNALLRRAKIAGSQKIEVGSLCLDAREHAAYINGDELHLTVREFDILYKLLSYPKKTFTRTALMDEFWDAASSSGPRVVDVYITKLREKLADCKDIEIITVHGLGYKAIIKE